MHFKRPHIERVKGKVFRELSDSLQKEIRINKVNCCLTVKKHVEKSK